MFVSLKDVTERIDPLYQWRAKHLYSAATLLEGALAGERTLRGMRPLAVLGDNITTDHLSPSNAILLDSAAGEICTVWDCPRKT